MSPDRLVIFDADGTLRWTTVPGQKAPYRRDEWRLLPRVQETLSAMHWGPGGHALGVASNQEAVPLGHLTRAAAVALLEDTLREAIGFLPAWSSIELCVCPLEETCACRKPAPGMLRRLMRRFAVTPAHTIFVGDLASDREAALRAGISFQWAKDFFRWEAT